MKRKEATENLCLSVLFELEDQVKDGYLAGTQLNDLECIVTLAFYGRKCAIGWADKIVQIYENSYVYLSRDYQAFVIQDYDASLLDDQVNDHIESLKSTLKVFKPRVHGFPQLNSHVQRLESFLKGIEAFPDTFKSQPKTTAPEPVKASFV